MSGMMSIADLVTATFKTSESQGGPRVLVCARCSSMEEEMRKHDDDWRPSPVRTWVALGVRYYGGLCYACGELEAKQRRAAKGAAAQAVEVREQRPQIGMASRPARRSWQAAR